MQIPLKDWRRFVPAEPRILIALGGLAALILFLIKLTEDVVEKESGKFDRAILLALRVPGDLSTPIGPGWLKSSVGDITSLGSPTIIALVTVVAVAYLLVSGRYRLGGLVGLSIALGATVEKLMKLGFDRVRPEVVPHFVAVHTLSFPSGHAMLSAMTYLTIGALLAKAQKNRRMHVFVLGTGVLLTVLIGVSRVYLGVHWPTDVLAGWTAGSIWALLTWLVAERIR